jgi:hypothetical protein
MIGGAGRGSVKFSVAPRTEVIPEFFNFLALNRIQRYDARH